MGVNSNKINKNIKTNYEKYKISLKNENEIDFSDISNNNIIINNIFKKGLVLINRYILKQKLNKNTWLSFDLKYGNYVSIKIKKILFDEIKNENKEIDFLKKIYKYNFDPEWIKSIKEYYKKDKYILNEINLIENTNIIQMLNSFIYEPDISNDKYLCNIYEITGITLQNFFNEYNNKNNKKGIPLYYLKIITKQILIGLDFIHRFGDIIHSNLNMDNILICLTKEELEIIDEIGYIYIEEDNNNIFNNEKLIKNLDNNNNNNNQKRKNEQRIIKRQEKQMEKIKINPVNKNQNKNISENNFNFEEYYKILNEQYDNNNINNKYKIEDIISRPRVSSIPKIDLKNNKYNFDINNYKNEIQLYIREKRKIKLNKNYLKDIFIKNNILENDISPKTRIEILKKLYKELIKKGPILDNDIKIKIGYFNDIIKKNKKNKNIYLNTKQKEKYLSPEIILGYDYNETIDIWALACIIFELATGDSLFETKRDSNFNLNENHIIKFIEILGNIPKKLIMRMKNPKIFYDIFNKITKTKNINKTNIKDILINKYNFQIKEAQELQDFLLPMLEYFPEKRISAKELLSHPWLDIYSNNNYNISNINSKNKNKNENNYNYLSENNDEEYMGDDEDNDKDIYNEYNEEDNVDDNPDKIIIPNYNNSFAEYGQFIDLTSLDKANPQFDEIMNKNEDE